MGALYYSMTVDVPPYFVLVVSIRTHFDSRYQKQDFESVQQLFVVVAAVAVVMTWSHLCTPYCHLCWMQEETEQFQLKIYLSM